MTELTTEVEEQLNGTELSLYRAAIERAGARNVEAALGVLSSFLVTGWMELGITAEQVQHTRLTVQQAIFTSISRRGQVSQTHQQFCEWLGVWAKDNFRHPAPAVFTTNYDTLIEAAADAVSLPCEMGITGQTTRRLDTEQLWHLTHPVFTATRPVTGGRKRATWVPKTAVPGDHFVLVKLHGSVAWEYDTPSRVIQSFSFPKMPNQPVLIYPEPNKEIDALSFPYRELIRTFAHWLRQSHTTTLIINGYSFGDQHLNRWILDALDGSSSLIVWLFVKQMPASLPNPVPKALRVVTENSCIVDGCQYEVSSSLWDFMELVRFIQGRVAV